MDPFYFHREHSRALSGHYAFGFTKMNLQITEIEAFDCMEITIHLIDGMTPIICNHIHRFSNGNPSEIDGCQPIYEMWAASRNWCREFLFLVDVRNRMVPQCKLSEKMIAHRVSPNFSIFGIKLHRTTRLYFLTDPKNIETKKS